MATAPKRAKGRSIRDFPDLSEAERNLLKACKEGEWAAFPTERPSRPTRTNTIRPGLIRFLLLGGDDQNPVHEKGVQLEGAWIVGKAEDGLDLAAVHSSFPLWLFSCNIQGAITLRDAKLPQLGLSGSSFRGLQGDRFNCTGGLFLRKVVCTGEAVLQGADVGGNLECDSGSFENARGDALSCDGAKIAGSVFLSVGFAAKGAVRLLGAEVGGDLACAGGGFENARGNALSCDRAKIAGSVFLKKGFAAEGEVRLLGVEVGGNLECDGGVFENAGGNALSCDRAKIADSVFLRNGFAAKGAVRLLGVEVGGSLACNGGSFENARGNALHCDGAVVKGGFVLRDVAKISGNLNLANMRCGSLIDNPEQDVGSLWIDGLTNGRFAGKETPTAQSRIAWLLKQNKDDLNESFRPQPWEQMIKVLREMGHEGEVRKVAIAKQQQMRVANKVGDFPLWQLHWLYGFFAGYGHEPLRAVSALLYFWLCGALAFQIADSYGIMGPTSPIINSSEIADLCGPRKGNLESTWTTCAAMPKEYTTFSAFWYSADLILPLVNLQQEADWAPIVARSELEKDGTLDYIPLGVFARLLMWIEILFGWAASLLLVAVLGNLVKKD